MEADFSGYATKAGLKCSDGRTITAEAFKNMDGMKVPLVWQHGHDKPDNVLGHALLEARDDGVYAYGYFNSTPQGENGKLLVQHDDIKSLSIYANNLVEKSKTVLHGIIREVSLVLSGANPGAVIDQVRIAHSDDDIEVLDDEAVIYTGLELEHSAVVEEEQEATQPTVQEVFDGMTEEQQAVVHVMVGAAAEHADTGSTDGGDETLQQVYDSFTPKQKQVVHFMIGAALEEASGTTSVAQSDLNNNEGDLSHQEGNSTVTNVFEQQNSTTSTGPTLSHDAVKGIVQEAQKLGSFKAAIEGYALEHSITDIDVLFPDAKVVGNNPELLSRRTEWVAGVIDGVKKSPFSRIKSITADLTAEEARAKGYVKGNLKKEEIIRLLKRVTTPTTVYKKQKLDRDDIIDITDMDVVAFLKWEMRLMLEEEVARAILIGDGREPDDEDKIDEEKVRPIAWDNEMYTHSVTVPSNVTPEAIVESVLRARKFYKGTGTPTFFTTDDILTDLILIKDKLNRRVYATEQELAAALRVDKIVVVEVMEDTPDLLGVIVNLTDYTVGADRGGNISMFDDFDIDYNQFKYLIETRASGALTKPKSAVVLKRTSGDVVTPSTPVFNFNTNKLTVPTVAGVEYYNVTDPTGDGVLLTAGDKYLSKTTDVEARATTGNSFPHNTDTDWTYAYNADAPAAPNGAVVI